MIFPAKIVTLVANVENTLVWSGADFQKSLGYAQPEQPISMVFTVQNGTAQVCYIAISFRTRNVTYAIKDRRSIAGIPAGGSLRISSDVAAELASLGPDLVSVTLYLISAAAGTITVIAEGSDTRLSPGSVGSGGQNIGLDERVVLDYIKINLSASAVVPGGSASTVTYSVPSGKRAKLVSIWGQIEATPLGYGDAFIMFSATGFAYAIRSEPFNPVTKEIGGDIVFLEAGTSIDLTIENDNPNAAVTRLIEAQAILQEYFS